MVVRALSVVVVCLFPVASFAAGHHAGPMGAPHGPAFTFSIGRGASSAAGSIHLRDFSRIHESAKPLDLSPSPKPSDSVFPSFSNPLHRHRMAFITF